MKNDTTVVRMRSGDYLNWRRKNVEKGHLAPSNLTFFMNCDRQKRFSQNERKREELDKFKCLEAKCREKP